MRKLTPVQIKDIPLEELMRILEIRAADLSIYIGNRGKVCLSGAIESVFLNGATVQINLETAALDDVMDDKAFRWAFAVEDFWRAFNAEEEAA
jgi:hypothetical protein